MSKNYLIIISTLIFNFTFGQDYSYKSKKYDLKIFEYLMERTKTDSITLDEYLEFSKPFSKWDIRPIKTRKVWAMDTIHSASTIPNFIWGSFSNKYNLSKDQASDKANDFLKEAVSNKNKNSMFIIKNLAKFKELSKNIVKSSNKVFLNQKSIQRIDNIYKENNSYWNYIIPKDSPFPLSDEISILTNEDFSKEQKDILKLLSQLKIYTAYKSDKGIYYLIDGFTDNSYGYFYNPEGMMETNNDLFEIMGYEEISANFFYYVAN
ncbi:MAG: hypothetical protein COA88_15990 [Kordia sp.]|nr:MAG: hypothetical protein COA88_15990 [Kordia sp.]